MNDSNREVISKMHDVACVSIKGNEELIKAFTSLQKENEELRELLREGCEVSKQYKVLGSRHNWEARENFLNRLEVKAILEKERGE